MEEKGEKREEGPEYAPVHGEGKRRGKGTLLFLQEEGPRDLGKKGANLCFNTIKKRKKKNLGYFWQRTKSTIGEGETGYLNGSREKEIG